MGLPDIGQQGSTVRRPLCTLTIVAITSLSSSPARGRRVGEDLGVEPQASTDSSTASPTIGSAASR